MSAPDPDYRVQDLLGRGGMGEVYRAIDPMGRAVALKRVTVTADASRLQRFAREGELTAQLDHPGIVRVHAAGSLDGKPFISYELIEDSRSLDEAFDDLPLEGRVDLLLQAAEALGHAHTRGVVHRDVKPENLLVDRDGRVKVADFGLATAADLERLTRTGALVGTPNYMAPEQVGTETDEIGPWTDVWALGVILYQTLGARRPFEGTSLVQLAGQILHATPPPLDLPRHDRRAQALAAVATWALEKRPSRRPPHGDALAAALRDALRGNPPRAAARRSPLPLLLTGAAALLASLAWLPRGAPPPAAAPAAPTPPTTTPEEDPPEERPLWQDRDLIGSYRQAHAYLQTHDDPALRAQLERARQAPLKRTRASWGTLHPPVHARFWDADTVLIGSPGAPHVFQWSLDRDDPEVLWEGGPRQRVKDLDVVGDPPEVVFARGQWIFRAARLDRDALTRREYVSASHELSCVALDPQRGRLASGGLDGKIEVVEVDGSARVFHVPDPERVWDVSFSADGVSLAAACGPTRLGRLQPNSHLRIWNLETGASHTFRYPASVSSLAPLPGSGFLAGGYGWSLAEHTPEAEVQRAYHDERLPPLVGSPLPPAHPHSVRDVLPGADWVASVSGSPDLEGGDVRIWSRDDGSLRWSISLSSRLTSLDVSPDGALLVVGTRNGWIQVWGAPP